MCGITGFLDLKGTSTEKMEHFISKMTLALEHRGPDAGAHWCDPETGIALGHRRLAIVDLSENGAQPMTSRSGRLTITYNGEVYNFTELREELLAKGCSFRGHSDTEVMLEGFEVWGVKETVKRLVGMFTFALWDRKTRSVTLARDRLGIKPLYWSFENGLLLFGSELKALREHPGFKQDIDRNALSSFFRHNYIPAPQSVYQNAHKLEQGHIMSVAYDGSVTSESFWTLSDVVSKAQKRPFTGSDAEATDNLENLLGDAIQRRMIADVPLGAFLSGGIDSSTVAALMQKNSDRPVKTFSIGFEEAGYNEADHAKAVAQHLGTDHTELYISGREARDVIPKLPFTYDEPFSDSSQIPTYLVSKMTRDHVTVALSGDGGDELFGGYTRYTAAASSSDKIFAVPKPARMIGATVLENMPTGFWQVAAKIAPPSLRFSNPANKAAKVARVLRGDKDDFYRTLVSHWDEPDDLVLGGKEYKNSAWMGVASNLVPDFVDRMQYIDTLTYMPDDILTKVDRASMAVSLEARVPMIDHRVVEFAWSLPQHLKIRKGQSKWLLRQVLYRHVPNTLIDRPKMGFGIPIADWLRGPLREWAESLLEEERLVKQNILNPKPIRKKWAEHLSGNRDWAFHLWDVLMFQGWYDEWIA